MTEDENTWVEKVAKLSVTNRELLWGFLKDCHFIDGKVIVSKSHVPTELLKELFGSAVHFQSSLGVHFLVEIMISEKEFVGLRSKLAQEFDNKGMSR